MRLVLRIKSGQSSNERVVRWISRPSCLECQIEHECGESTCNSLILAKLLAILIIE